MAVMDLRHLRYFVTLAEERHFIRATERLGIKQPPLSQQIRQLEQEMGTALFHRLTRGVELTEAGNVFLEDALKILEQAAHAKANVQSRARGETGRIHFGFAGATYFHPGVLESIHAYRERYPNVRPSPEQSNTPRLIESLRAGTIVLALVRPPVDIAEGIVIEPLVEEPMRVVLPTAHAQARSRSVPLTILAEETLLLFPRAIGPGFYDNHRELLARRI